MAIVTTNARVTASDPGAFLDAEAWIFTVTFTDPLTGQPADLPGSRLFVTFGAQTPVGFVAIQTCDSAADDGSLTIADDTSGRATFVASPASRSWTAPRLGLALGLPTIVEGDVFRQVDTEAPVCLASLRLLVKPSSGRPTPWTPPSRGGAMDFSNPDNSGLVPALTA